MSVEALILAAGRGNRMLSLTEKLPKCMLEVGGTSLIRRQIGALRAEGISPITVVSGFGHTALEAHVGGDVRLVYNKRFATTNSLHSFWLGAQRLRGPFVVLNADVLFHPVLLRRLLESPHEDVLLADLRRELGKEEMKVKIEQRRLADIGRRLPRGSYDGENVGILKYGDAARRALVDISRWLIEEGRARAPFPLATKHLARERRIEVISTEGLPWVEIDFPEDLERAHAEIVPRLGPAGGEDGTAEIAETRHLCSV